MSIKRGSGITASTSLGLNFVYNPNRLIGAVTLVGTAATMGAFDSILIPGYTP